VHEAYLSLGSNLGDREAALRGAIEQLRQLECTEVSAVSSFYESSPVGFVSAQWFLNCAVRILTRLPPPVLLDECERIEALFGREKQRGRRGEPGDRALDIDLILYEELTLFTWRLQIPHPEATRRLFVLLPLAELEPEIRLGEHTVEEWAELTRAEHPEQQVRLYRSG